MSGSSEFTVSTQPPSGWRNVAFPSGKSGQTYPVPATGAPLAATTREVKPCGTARPNASGGPSGP
jgi:hypothetical protein